MQGKPMWFEVLLTLHIIAGFGTFLLAPVALATAKGGKAHKRWGMVYLWCMGGVAATAIPMAFFEPILFLALVAVFSFYAAFAGYRITRLKDLYKGGQAQAIDWIAAIITVGVGFALIYFGWFEPQRIQVIGPVAIAFGVIALRLAGRQIARFVSKPTEKMFWWYDHLGLFIGSYIASWSAFSVVTLTRVIGNHWYVWLWPTIIGVPAIVLTTGYYKRKFAPKEKGPTLVAA